MVAAESALLSSRGHRVEEVLFDNTEWSDGGGPGAHVRRGLQTVWSTRALARTRRAVRAFRPEIVHVHNTFPSASPSIYSAVPRGTPVIQTLHNYRLLCPVATFYRDGHVCTDCLGRRAPMPGVVHSCYRNSTMASATVAAMLTLHNVRRTWHNRVDRFIALTEFARGMFVDGGLPSDRIRVKPNFLEGPVPDTDQHGKRDAGFLFVGRLASEKGLRTLLTAAKEVRTGVTIIGAGPLDVEVETAASAGVRAVGHLPKEEVALAMGRASALVFPSEWFEGFPVTLLEAFSAGLPVIAAAIGGIPEIVTDGETGLLFSPGDARALGDRMRWAETHPIEMRQMATNARNVLTERYGANRNYELLMDIYRGATARARHGQPER